MRAGRLNVTWRIRQSRERNYDKIVNGSSGTAVIDLRALRRWVHLRSVGALLVHGRGSAPADADRRRRLPMPVLPADRGRAERAL